MSYRSKVHRLARFNQRFGRIFIPLWIALAALFTVVAAADTVWRLKWGYSRGDALLGASMVGFGILFWVGWNLMLTLISWFNETFFGPEPDCERGSPD